MSLLLGIDTGGTYTDAVLLDSATGEVRRSAKVPTTHHDLVEGVDGAVRGLGTLDPHGIDLVSLSTTLATNSAIEGLGARVGAVLIGYDREMLERYRLDRHIHAACVAYVAGRHDVFGAEVEPLDEEGLRAAIRAQNGQVDTFAISSYLAARNPEHEHRARAIAAELTDHPVVVAGDLSAHLNSVRRATTAVLNAQLLPEIGRLLDAAEALKRRWGIGAPVTAVRSDGSLMGLDLARARPIETVLSGPAASAAAAARLTDLDAALVVDMGGTTTDALFLQDGRPQASERGASIGGWRTAVRAVDVRTAGIGGDSRIVADPLDLSIGPRRVTPLARAAAQYPAVGEALEDLQRRQVTHRLLPAWEFVAAGRPAGDEPLTETEGRVLDAVADGPLNTLELAGHLGVPDAHLLNVRGLEARGLLERAGLTPTDILHARGAYTDFDVRAAQLGCQIAARESRMETDEFVARVHETVVSELSIALLRKAIAAHEPRVAEEDGPLGRFLLARSSSRAYAQPPLGVNLNLSVPIVAIGAPVHAWMPEVAERLRAELVIPPHAEVASAVGAVSGGVLEEIELLLRPQYARRGIIGYSTHSPVEYARFRSRQQAREHILATGPQIALQRARQAGAADPQVQVEERSWDAQSDEPGGGAYLMETRFRFTAVGRPRF